MISIDGKSKMICLLGNPVDHSLSPKLQNEFCEFYDYNGFYCAFNSTGENLENTIKALKSLNFLGCNVTYPLKEEIIKYLDYTDDNSKLLNAVNTVKMVDDKLYGYNTDSYGFEMLLKHNDINPSDREVAILGTGGASRSVALGLINLNVSKIHFFSRDNSKKIIFGNKGIDSKIFFHSYEEFGNLAENLFMVINGTPLGMENRINETPLDSKFLNGIEVAVDLIYKPAETLFLKNASAMGCKTVNGYHMLFFQGIKSFEIWTGVEATKYGIILRKNTQF